MGLGYRRCGPGRGRRHLVFSSVLHAVTTDLVQHEIKRDIEEHLLSSGLEFTILQPANYMLPLKLRPVFERACSNCPGRSNAASRWWTSAT